MSKVLVVTGSSRGIGAAIALLGAKEGYGVAVNYRSDREGAEALVRDIARQGGRAAAVCADVSTSDGAAKLFAEVDRTLGTVSALVNNAGISGSRCPIDAIDEDRLRRIFETNVFSAFFCLREAVRRMRRSSGGAGGSIVNISSAAARHGGMPELAHYASTKAALDGMTIALAKELGPQGVRVNSLRPGVIVTDMHDEFGGAKLIESIAPTIPMRRPGTVDEVAEAALWLASERSSYVHGAVIDVAGGR
ncbi:sugar dehydrogenase [Variovorax paradoxus]|jgi:NAD(P)-dependent dehydrogenase (short-subunit alcohol dehydrogenase family)|uniref:SDR family oxidoreductase n=1 Tax=Variovorax paradoxus TaxID=34073 RepID=UPI0006E6782A|nr:sugar dehydrogenase [Variovorax paradoxus]KPV00808.1 sugar dehydrogenase [Variovorax paradoxus]KPV01671.1 sugar dehydrogenase [Variovorax paradoxus]KPV17122.1 sugar dehydrogenase [Variovorax paradoxus]KPV26909.1 sugar dehydrogenase [Variovorax paradoxus]